LRLIKVHGYIDPTHGGYPILITVRTFLKRKHRGEETFSARITEIKIDLNEVKLEHERQFSDPN
jgi:hypothetical protein